jgi:hypothetical protein
MPSNIVANMQTGKRANGQTGKPFGLLASELGSRMRHDAQWLCTLMSRGSVAESADRQGSRKDIYGRIRRKKRQCRGWMWCWSWNRRCHSRRLRALSSGWWCYSKKLGHDGEGNKKGLQRHIALHIIVAVGSKRSTCQCLYCIAGTGYKDRNNSHK